MLLSLDVDQNLGIHPEYALGYVHAGLAAVAGIARTPSFVLCVPRCIPRRGSDMLESQRLDRSGASMEMPT